MRSPRALQGRLLSWFRTHRRDLPWRRTRDPYAIWIAEIMLQQTRVAAAIGYYERFLKRFPTLEALAVAEEAEVLALWSGLGYYRRARMIREAARCIAEVGQFPRTAEGLQKLPGIGRYTAAAVASIAFAEPVAVVDGNVERILARMSGDAVSSTRAWEWAQRLLDPRAPGAFNEAMMELGATICTPRAPQCGLCPVSRWCATKGEHEVPPARPRKRASLRFALHRRGDKFLLVQRRACDRLMAGMWELPAARPPLGKLLARAKHSITSTDYAISLYLARKGVCVTGKWVQPGAAESYPLTGVTRKLLKLAGLLQHPNP